MTESGNEDLTPREEIAVERSAQLADELRGATPSDEMLSARQEHKEELSLAELQIRQHETDALRAKLISDDFEKRFNTQLAAAREKQAADEELSPADQTLLDRAAENQARVEGLSSIPDNLVAERDAHTDTIESDHIYEIADKVSAEHIKRDAKEHHLRDHEILYEGGRKLMEQDLAGREVEAQRLREELAPLERKLKKLDQDKDDITEVVDRITQGQVKMDSLMREFSANPTDEKKAEITHTRTQLESDLHMKDIMDITLIERGHELIPRVDELRKRIGQLEAHLSLPSKDETETQQDEA